jgi:hypothetical protein
MHPYSKLPIRHFWKKFVSDSPWRDLGLNDQPKFSLIAEDKVATAGSCFAQHISRHMAKVGLEPYIAESAHILLQEFGGDIDSYRSFSARYGNIYTVRQFLELFRQAFSMIEVIEDFVENEGRWYDLLRPSVHKAGFASKGEASADRAYHLERVKLMFETADVLIFTLGLTESWYNAESGHTYPVCPGTVHGTYEPKLHLFHNFTCAETINDLEIFIEELKRVNPKLRIILTVSPVPLVATYSTNNVLVASNYSKSVLRAAVGEVETRHAHVAYFPSYEIISHPASFGQYLASDLREVTERGVNHVMDCFLSSYYGIAANNASVTTAVSEQLESTSINQYSSILPLPECDELMNVPFAKSKNLDNF